MVWYKVFRAREEKLPEPQRNDPLDKIQNTPSMRAVGKFAITVIGLFVLQVLLRALTAHYTVEGDSFLGLPN